jgi:hypothetical protein
MKCSGKPTEDSEPDCFYAGVLENSDVSIILMDTSHYEGVSTYGDLSGAKGFAGKSQTNWIAKQLEASSDTDRVVASHYAASSFEGYIGETRDGCSMKTDIGHVGDLFNLKDGRGNLWLWGHTHADVGTLTTRSLTGLASPLTIETYEVGSTTDFGNAGALISNTDGKLTMATKPLCQLFSVDACAALPSALDKTDLNKQPFALAVDSIGITRVYQNGPWSPSTEADVRTNIRDLTSTHYAKYGFKSQTDMQLCLLRLASAMERYGNYRVEGLHGEECEKEP